MSAPPEERHDELDAGALLVVGLFLAVTIAAFEAMAIITALPTIVDELDGSSLYGATLAANMLANLVAITWAGEAADRHGPGKPFARCALSFVAGLVVAGSATTMPQVVAGRVLQGFGVGGFQALAYVAVRRGFAAHRRPKLFAALSAGWVLPSLVAPFLAGWITDRFGWRWVFLAIIPLTGVAAALTLRQLLALGPAPDAPEERSGRVPLALRLALGAALVAGGLPSSHPLVAVGVAGVGVVIAAGPLRRLFPAGWTRLAPGVPVIVVCRLCAAVGFLGIDAFIPLAADRVHHATPTAQGAMIIGAALTWTVGQAVSARLTGRVAPRHLIGAGFCLLAAGGVLVSPVIRTGTPLIATFFAWAVGGLGMGLLFNPTTVLAMASAGDSDAGLVSGQLNTADSLGFATVTTLGGAIVAASERGSFGLTGALTATFAIAVGAALLGGLISRRVVPAAR